MSNEKITFRNRNNRGKGNKSNPGSGFATTYRVELDDKGHKKVVVDGETNLYASIQEHLEETLVQNIIDRASMGDEEALNRIQGQYIDATNLPKTLAEAQQKINNIRETFDKLPLDIRREFNFSAEEYVAQLGTEEFAKKVGIKTETKVEEEKVTKETGKEKVAND